MSRSSRHTGGLIAPVLLTMAALALVGGVSAAHPSPAPTSLADGDVVVPGPPNVCQVPETQRCPKGTVRREGRYDDYDPKTGRIIRHKGPDEGDS